jgi:hypothetical protein
MFVAPAVRQGYRFQSCILQRLDIMVATEAGQER